jgi:hypothetical protein
VGTLAVIAAAATCVPLAYLAERGGATIWPPAVLHGLIGTWQIYERTYPVQFKLVILIATALVPLSASRSVTATSTRPGADPPCNPE